MQYSTLLLAVAATAVLAKNSPDRFDEDHFKDTYNIDNCNCYDNDDEGFNDLFQEAQLVCNDIPENEQHKIAYGDAFGKTVNKDNFGREMKSIHNKDIAVDMRLLNNLNQDGWTVTRTMCMGYFVDLYNSCRGKNEDSAGGRFEVWNNGTVVVDPNSV